MDHSNVTVTLPMTEHGFVVILTALGIGVGTGIVWLVLREQGRAPRENPTSLLAAFAVIMGPVWLLIFAGTLWQVWLMLAGVPSALGSGPSLGMGALLAALLGAPFLVWGTVLKQRTVDFQKEGHITDRINKAVEQLGAEKTISYVARNISRPSVPPEEWQEHHINEYVDQLQKIDSKIASVDRHLDEDFKYGDWEVFTETVPNIEVRIGAILSLERIAQDSTRYDNGRDHVRVMEILCAYVRENTATPSLEPELDEDGPFTPRTDIQISIDVIKRRRKEQIDIEAGERYRLDLRRCDFRGVDLSLGSFRGAILAQSRFDCASMRSADFSGARFDGSVLNYLDCIETKFTGADMRRCRIDRPDPRPGGFISTINMGNLTGLSLISANIPSVQYLGKENGFTFGTKDTVLDWELDEQRKVGVKIRQHIDRMKDCTCSDDVAKLQEQLSGNPFVNWSPYDGSDMTTGHLLQKFRKSLSLVGWPYDH